ncbi:MAG: DUF1775 domain-containing protein [Bryobacterales bacterium]|nr:DUF1775 domain-containing protein [Bryobacterales bacterium]
MFSQKIRTQILLAALTTATVAHAHVTIRPRESAAGVSQQYTMRVPTEKAIATVRIELEFPALADISAVDEKPGWKLELRRDAAGKLVGATWTGSKIGPREVEEFTFTARNPNEETRLEWKAIQIYEDGSRSEWTGPAGSRTPASVTGIKKALDDR